MLSTTFLTLSDPGKLRTRMDEVGLSNRKLAAQVGFSPARIAQLTAGQYQEAAAEPALAIAAALDVDVTDLWTFPDGEALVRLGLIRSV